MYYEIFRNNIKVATVGPTDSQHISISVSTTEKEGNPFIMANGMSEVNEKGERQYSTWLENDISKTDSIKIVPVENSEVTTPIKVRRLRGGAKPSKEDVFCEFCERSEEEVGKIVQAGESPYICKQCAELVLEIINE